MMPISPKYLMHLAKETSEAIWREFVSYDNVLAYIERWHEVDENGYNYWENFEIIFKNQNSRNIDLLATLNKMDGELLMKVAIDVGVETPDFVPSIPKFRNEIKEQYSNASEVFEKAFKNVEDDPSLSIGLANSALESIIKDIIKNQKIDGYKETESLSKQASTIFRYIIKELEADSSMQPVKELSSALLNACKAIEDLRSTKTCFHGKSSGEKDINDPIFAYFIINATASVGLFLLKYFSKEKVTTMSVDDDLPF